MGKLCEIEGWAPPGSWGPWNEITDVTGKRTITVQIETISKGPSSFDARLEYWNGNTHKSDLIVVPGSATYTFRMDCICKPKIRFKSHSSGQTVRVYFIEVHR